MHKYMVALALGVVLLGGCASMFNGLPSLDMAEDVASAPCPDGRTLYKAVFPMKDGERIIAFGFMNAKGQPYHPSAYLYFGPNGGEPIRARVDGKEMTGAELLERYRGPCDLPSMSTA